MSWQMTFNNLVLPKSKKSHAYIHDWAIWSIGVNRSLTASKARNSHARAFEGQQWKNGTSYSRMPVIRVVSWAGGAYILML